MENEKKWADHAEFLSEMSFNVGAVLLADEDGRVQALAVYTGWLSEQCFNHADKHIQDSLKINPGEQNEGVAAPEEVKAHTDMYDAWNDAKKGPVSTQEEIGDRWKEAEKDG